MRESLDRKIIFTNANEVHGSKVLSGRPNWMQRHVAKNFVGVHGLFKSFDG